MMKTTATVIAGNDRYLRAVMIGGVRFFLDNDEPAVLGEEVQVSYEEHDQFATVIPVDFSQQAREAGFKPEIRYVKNDPRGSEYGEFIADRIINGEQAGYIQVTHTLGGYTMLFDSCSNFVTWAKA